MKKWVQGRVRRHGGKLSLLVGVMALGAGLGLIVAYWGWLADGQAGSTAVRNVGLVVGGAIALWIAIWRGVVADRQANAARAQAEAAQQQAAIAQQQAEMAEREAEMAGIEGRAQRYKEGTARLVSNVLLDRLTGIEILEELAQGYPEAYHIEAMETLCRFVRHPVSAGSVDPVQDARSQGEAASPGGVPVKVRPDVQAAMDAICACHGRQLGLETDAGFGLDLRETDLRGLVLTGQDLSNSPDLSLAHLGSAYLRGVKLMGARLIATELRRVDFLAADLSRADFTHANLQGALLQEANISGALFALPFDFDETPAPGSPRGLTQAQLDLARADPAKPPYLRGVLDAETGKQLVWRGRTLDGKPHPNPPPIPDD